MSKYPNEQTVGAVYDDASVDNPFLAAMPDMLPPEKLFDKIESKPRIPHNMSLLTAEERRRQIPVLNAVFIPMSYMYNLYDTLYRAIQTTYTTRTMLDEIRQINALFNNGEKISFSTGADSGSILGVPGIGKTSTIKRCLSTMPQVIEHTEYMGKPFYCKQILYLQVECPSDCSVKTLAFNILAALDRAIGSHYLDNLTVLRSASASAAATQVKILCITHHVGLILVDEIQNAVVTARKNRQVKPLIKFLVELTNDTCTGTYFVGTPLAEELFVSQEHLKRRTRGMRLLPLKPDGAYLDFLNGIWGYQYTVKPASMTDKLASKLYDYSGGIPAYIVKIFAESQVQALLIGRSCIDEKIMQRAIDILAIKVPKTYAGGTYISDFELDKSEDATLTKQQPDSEKSGVPRMYANKRGRKAEKRDNNDLILALKDGIDILHFLRERSLIEDRREISDTGGAGPC